MAWKYLCIDQSFFFFFLYGEIRRWFKNVLVNARVNSGWCLSEYARFRLQPLLALYMSSMYNDYYKSILPSMT
jgi:hypothetical protein